MRKKSRRGVNCALSCIDGTDSDTYVACTTAVDAMSGCYNPTITVDGTTAKMAAECATKRDLVRELTSVGG